MEQQSQLEAPFTLWELFKAMAKGKALGPDGLPVQVFIANAKVACFLSTLEEALAAERLLLYEAAIAALLKLGKDLADFRSYCPIPVKCGL